MIWELLDLILFRIAYPLLLEHWRKRDLDPAFAAKSDEVFSELSKAETTTAKREALRKLHALQKS